MERGALATLRTIFLRVALFVGLLESNVLFYSIRGFADDTPVPHEQLRLPTLDRFIGLGAMPGQRLQSLFFTGHVGAFDWFFVLAYESWFVAPVLVTTYVLIFHWDQIGSYLPVRLAAYFIPLGLFFLLPSEPPWMATGTPRITSLANSVVLVDSNQLAAFPSLHVTLTVALACWLWSKRLNVAATLFSVYTGIIAFAVLYLGEHYFVDVFAGAALAIAIARVSARAEDAIARGSLFGLRQESTIQPRIHLSTRPSATLDEAA